jgi:hypothetical protein
VSGYGAGRDPNLPWKAVSGVISDASGFHSAIALGIPAEQAAANERLIVKAVNMHNRLVESLEELLPLMEMLVRGPMIGQKDPYVPTFKGDPIPPMLEKAQNLIKEAYDDR